MLGEAIVFWFFLAKGLSKSFFFVYLVLHFVKFYLPDALYY